MSRSRGALGIGFRAVRGDFLQMMLAVLVGLSCSRFVMADDDESVKSELTTVIEQLENPSFEKREEATRHLGELIDFDFNVLYVFLKDYDLSAEQRNRVLKVINDKLINRPRGALGISMNTRPNPRNNVVEITALVVGMPAEKVLKVGDRIRRIDNTVIRHGEDLRWVVQTRMPGDKILITLDRPKSDKNGLRLFNEQNQVVYEFVQVELELGSVAVLSRSSNGNINSKLVQDDRMRQAQVAAAIFAPKPRLITVRNPEDLHQALLGPDPDFPEVDKHSVIKLMLSDLERIVKGDKPLTTADEERWNSYQRQLALEVAHPGNSPERMEFLKKVFKRFLKLRQK